MGASVKFKIKDLFGFCKVICYFIFQWFVYGFVFISAQFGLGFFCVGLYVCLVFFEEGEWGKPGETGTRMRTELQRWKFTRTNFIVTAIYKTLIWHNFETKFRKNLWNSFQTNTTKDYFMSILSIELTLETPSFKQISGKT